MGVKRFVNIFVFAVVMAIVVSMSGTAAVYADTDDAEGPDPNFHIYLAFGQDNMMGHGKIEDVDMTVNGRFKMMCSASGMDQKTVGEWYEAVPPLANKDAKLGVADYFGRTMAEKTDPEITIGVIVVAVNGSSIKLFDKNRNGWDSYMNQQAGWFKDQVNAYGGYPYDRLIELGRKAQKDGVIKGIIMHQGETDAGDGEWPSKVKVVYDNIVKDLELGNDVPLLAGEVLRSGVSNGANSNIAKLPELSRNFYVISSEGLVQANSDGQNMHFTSEEYRLFGARYANKMIELIEPAPTGHVHVWGDWKVTKEPTPTAKGIRERVCSDDMSHIERENIPASSRLFTKMTSKGKNSLVITWSKMKGASGYEIYFTKCDHKSKNNICKKIKTVKAGKTLKCIKKGLKGKTSYKAFVIAYKVINGEKVYMDTSLAVHAFTSGGNKVYTNASKMKVKKARLTLNKGKTSKIKATVTKQKKSRKMKLSNHAAKLRYISSNKKVAVVNSKGKITAKSKGKCKIYVITVNGVRKTVSVTVK